MHTSPAVDTTSSGEPGPLRVSHMLLNGTVEADSEGLSNSSQLAVSSLKKTLFLKNEKSINWEDAG